MIARWWDTTASFSTGVPFAVDSAGNWRDVDDVRRGKACACYCAACHGALIARHGEVRVHHFAHGDRKECREALEASLFGMAVQILRHPGAQLRLPAAYDVVSIARATREESHKVARALDALGLTPCQSTLTLGQPVATCHQLKDTRKDTPDIEDAGQDFALHILSSPKMLYMLEKLPHQRGHVLAINPLAFARSWYASVCDPDRDQRAQTVLRAKDKFRSWLAESVDGRGWLTHPEVNRVAALVKERIEATKVRYIRPDPTTIPPRPLTSLQWAPPTVAKTKAPPPPDRPDQVLEKAVDTCRLCGSPMDIVLQGSGLFAGKRLLICRTNPKHPMRHLG